MRIAIVFLVLLLAGAAGIHALTRSRPVAPIDEDIKKAPLPLDIKKILRDARYLKRLLSDGVSYNEYSRLLSDLSFQIDEWDRAPTEFPGRTELRSALRRVKSIGGIPKTVWDWSTRGSVIPENGEHFALIKKSYELYYPDAGMDLLVGTSYVDGDQTLIRLKDLRAMLLGDLADEIDALTSLEEKLEIQLGDRTQ